MCVCSCVCILQVYASWCEQCCLHAAKNVCGQVQTTNCSTHTLKDTQKFNQLCTTGGALAACKHTSTNIISVYVCMCTRQTQNKTKHKRKTNNNNNMRKNQLTSSSLLCCCCWPCQQVGARTFGFGKVINFQLSLFVCLLFLALQESHKV